MSEISFPDHFYVADGFASHPALGWVLGAVALLYFYFGTLYARSGKKAQSTSGQRTSNPHIGLSLFGGIALFLFIDGLIFHSGFYSSFLSPNSFAGRVAYQTATEHSRPSDRGEDVLVLGDSRIGEGFSARVANEHVAGAGLSFVDLSIALSSPRVWFYMLREVDPQCDRYRAIVIPLNDQAADLWQQATDRAYDIALVAPLLRWNDAVDLSHSFEKWPNRCRAVAACLFRGSAFQSDLIDLLEHPQRRRKELEFRPLLARSIYEYTGSKEDVTGVSYDGRANAFVFPERLTKFQRESIEQSVRPPRENDGRSAAYARRWIGRIVEKYRGSSTPLVFLRMPHGPFGAPSKMGSGEKGADPSFDDQGAISVDADLFKILEAPEFFADGSHLNARGRRRFSEILSDELVRRLVRAEKPPYP